MGARCTQGYGTWDGLPDRSPGITPSSRAGHCPDPSCPLAVVGARLVGTWLLDPLHRSHIGRLESSSVPVAYYRPPDGSGLGDSEAQSPRVPSLPRTLLPNFLCGNHACYHHSVLLATAKFPLLVPDPLLCCSLQETKSCCKLFPSGSESPLLAGPAFFGGDGRAFFCIWGGRKAGLEKGLSRDG